MYLSRVTFGSVLHIQKISNQYSREDYCWRHFFEQKQYVCLYGIGQIHQWYVRRAMCRIDIPVCKFCKCVMFDYCDIIMTLL